MYTIKKVVLDCFQDGERQMRLDLKFKKPLELPLVTKKHKDFFIPKIRSWCASDYEQVIVTYAGPSGENLSRIYTLTSKKGE